jgi:hypothetical protein
MEDPKKSTVMNIKYDESSDSTTSKVDFDKKKDLNTGKILIRDIHTKLMGSATFVCTTLVGTLVRSILSADFNKQ